METHDMEDIQQRKWTRTPHPAQGCPSCRGGCRRPGLGGVTKQSLVTTTKNRAHKIPNTVLGERGSLHLQHLAINADVQKICCENLKFTSREGQGWALWKDAIEKMEGRRGVWVDAVRVGGASGGKQDGQQERPQTSRSWRKGALSQPGPPGDGGGTPGKVR